MSADDPPEVYAGSMQRVATLGKRLGVADNMNQNIDLNNRHQLLPLHVKVVKMMTEDFFPKPFVMYSRHCHAQYPTDAPGNEGIKLVVMCLIYILIDVSEGID